MLRGKTTVDEVPTLTLVTTGTSDVATHQIGGIYTGIHSTLGIDLVVPLE